MNMGSAVYISIFVHRSALFSGSERFFTRYMWVQVVSLPDLEMQQACQIVAYIAPWPMA
jgi:hypothetical protein